jgi:hypothetical protein
VNWISFIATLVSIVSTITSYLKDRQAIEAGAAEDALKHLQGASDALNAAIKTKLDVDQRTSGHDAAGKLRDDSANLYRD